eukprot:m.62578 g.62578  ORF g.62578 m.62578 type:complete len:72 (-) comp23173_c0_seq2:287-502(-)
MWVVVGKAYTSLNHSKLFGNTVDKLTACLRVSQHAFGMDALSWWSLQAPSHLKHAEEGSTRDLKMWTEFHA